jgi:hypothetical protein
MNTAGHVTRIGRLAQVEAQRWRLPRRNPGLSADLVGTFATVEHGWLTTSMRPFG